MRLNEKNIPVKYLKEHKKFTVDQWHVKMPYRAPGSGTPLVGLIVQQVVPGAGVS